jgi:hypothetical protein
MTEAHDANTSLGSLHQHADKEHSVAGKKRARRSIRPLPVN